MFNKKGAAPEVGSGRYAAAAIVGIFMILLILYLVIAPPEHRKELIPGYTDYIKPYSNNVLDVIPGTIEKTDEAKTEDIKVKLDDVVIAGAATPEENLLMSDYTVYKGALSYDFYKDSFTAGTDISRAGLEFNVVKKEGNGEIIVKLNGRTMYSAVTYENQHISVDFPKNLIINGVNNMEISVSSPSFFGKNSYRIADIYLTKYTYTEENTIAERTFQVSEDAINGLEKAELTGSVDRTSRTPKALRIELNGRIIYKAIPSNKLSVNIPIEYIQKDNTIKFSTERDGGYGLDRLKLELETTYTGEGRIGYEFEVGENDWSLITGMDYDMYECIMNVSRSAGASIISIDINDNKMRYSFSDENKIIADICTVLKYGTNEIKFYSDESVTLDHAMITVRNKEYGT